MLEKIRQNTFGHFKYLPEAAGFSVKTKQALTIINCGPGSLMFSIVYGNYHAEKIQGVTDEFKGQPLV